MGETVSDEMRTSHPVYVAPELGIIPDQFELRIEGQDTYHNGPLADKQVYSEHTEEDHGTWEILYRRQRDNLTDIAYTPWLQALDEVGLNPSRIPSFAELTKVLKPKTGWTVVPVQGFLSGRDYFWYLAQRLFPAVPRIRSRANLEFIVEPDLFHDAFGHVPMHANEVFSEFVALYGRVCRELEGDSQKSMEMGRLYWFTVEYGLIEEDSKIKVCGSGHMSSIKESRFSLTNGCKKRPFSMEAVISQDYNPHILQEVLFVMESYEQLHEAMMKKAAEYGIVV
jgi:phenylalanine-4-hydroxylase